MSTLLSIVVVYSPAPRTVQEHSLRVSAGTTVGQALAQLQATLPANVSPTQASSGRYGVWGKRAKLSQVLRDADRIEIYRPLTVDPQTARRERFARQGSKGAGLFAKTRAGAKQGY